jgi:phosphohistidine phosphatase
MRLIVMRHAKAEQSAPSDFERRLADRGRSDAREAGAWLAERGWVPDHALVSAAVRTQETFAALAEGGGFELAPTLDRSIYSAHPETVLDVVRLTPSTVRSLLVIGHNPTMASLAQLLHDGSGDEAAITKMSGDFPTSALALLEYDGAWPDLDWTTCELADFHMGRGEQA